MRVSREQLYEKVWLEPLRAVAKRYGVSDVALGKHCRRLGVPTSGVGYWHAYAAGIRGRRELLPSVGGKPAVLLLFLSSTAVAQADSVGSAEWVKRTCAAAAAALSAPGVGGDDFVRALTTVQTCPDHRPESLRRLWAAPPKDSMSLRVLSDVSGQVRDGRVFDTVGAAASNPTLGTDARLAAIAALTSLARPGFVVRFAPPRPGSPEAGRRVEFGQLTDFVLPREQQAFDPGTARREAIDLLSRLAESDPDATVRHVTGVIARWLDAHT